MPRCLLPLVLAAVVLARGSARADCEDADALRAELVAEAARADRWNLAWRITYTVGTVAQIAPAAAGVADRDTTQTLWIGGISTAVGALGGWLTPLEIPVPPPVPDRCADRAAVQQATQRAAAEERQAFWLLHAGSLVVSAGAAVATAARVSWQAGALAFALGYPVSLLQIYTLPRGLWHRDRGLALAARVSVGSGGAWITVQLAGSRPAPSSWRPFESLRLLYATRHLVVP